MTTNPIPTTAGRDACATSAIHNFHLDEDFQRMPPKQQERVKLFAEMMETMHVAILGGAPKNAAAREQAAANAHIDGCSTVNIKKRYYEWLEKGKDWRVLRDRALIQRLASDVDVELIDDLVRKQFFDFYGGFIQQNQRKNAPAYRAFLRHWFSGGKVPGYGTWPEYWTAKGHAYLTKCPTRRVAPRLERGEPGAIGDATESGAGAGAAGDFQGVADAAPDTGHARRVALPRIRFVR